jgi:hypothetical protein
MYQQLPKWNSCHQQQCCLVWTCQGLEPRSQTHDLYPTHDQVTVTVITLQLAVLFAAVICHSGHRLTTHHWTNLFQSGHILLVI